MTGKRRVGLYPGTFDPITLGHLDIIKRGAKLVDHLILGVSTNPSKQALFSLDERVEMVRRETAFIESDNGVTIEVKPFNTLLMSFAEEVGATAIIRGLRAVSDFEYEFQMTGMNAKLDPEIETVFLMAADKWQFVSSSFVKEIATLGGEIEDFVTPQVSEKLKMKCM